MQVFSFADPDLPTEFANSVAIFLGSEMPEVGSIDDAFSRWTRSNVVPPTVLIVGELTKLQLLLKDASDAAGNVPGLDRLAQQSTVVFAGFNRTGHVYKINKSKAEADLTEVFHRAIEIFIGTQVEGDDVVIPGPPGFYFDKLSGNLSSHFIRAESLLQSTGHIELIALRLLKPFHVWCEKLGHRGEGGINIFIDTMGMWPIAEKLTQMHKLGGSSIQQYILESFKSYDGLKDWHPLPRPAFIIISATTSGRLAEKVVQKVDRTSSEIWTIISLEATAKMDSECSNAVASTEIFTLSRKLTGKPTLEGLRPVFETNIKQVPPGCETISIVGERFLNQNAKPKLVRLVHKSLDDDTKEILTQLARWNLTKVARGKFDGKARWSVSFDMEQLLKKYCADEENRPSLLKTWLRNYSFPGPIAIVYPSNPGPSAAPVTKAGRDLAVKVQDLLREATPGISAEVFSSDELNSTAKMKEARLENCGVIVVAPVIGNGFVFKQISAQLRHVQPQGPRLFLAFAVLPESHAHLEQLKNDLKLASDECFYEFKYKFAIPIGRLDSSFEWDKEIKVLENVVKNSEEKNEFLSAMVKERIEFLSQRKELDGNHVFLPTLVGKPLPLSSGFALWEKNVAIAGDGHGAIVLLTIAAFLEASRAARSKADATSLKTGLFQHALIAPENFTRFNDGVIQAALLRAAYPSELNYSVSPEASHDMERLLLKWLDLAAEPAGYAAAEFLFALCQGRLKLCNGHTENVLRLAREKEGWLASLAEVAAAQLGFENK